jgi:fructose-bisphosphate aldolase class II
MHGGSGLSEDDFKNAIGSGISKINYYTGMSIGAAGYIREKLENSGDKTGYHQIMLWGMEAIKEDVRKTMKLFGSSNMA